MAIATCGHEVEEGIPVSYMGTTREGEPCSAEEIKKDIDNLA